MKINSVYHRMPAFAGILLLSLSIHAQVPSQADTMPDSLTKTEELKEVIVNATRWKGKDKIGQLTMSGAEINKMPVLLGERDIIKALQTKAGVVGGTEGFAGLYVRGGETDQNLYLVDGLPLMNVYHLGGLFSMFNTRSVESVDFYKGIFPSRFSERGSGIIDIALKHPDYEKTSGSLSVGLISGQFYLTTPLRKGKAAFSVALRRTWFDLFSVPALAILNATKKSDGRKTSFNYNFTDLMIRLDATGRNGNYLSCLMFYGKDNFRLGEERFDPDDSKYIYGKDLNRMSWGNYGVSVDYQIPTRIGKLKLQPYLSKAFSSETQENMDDPGDEGRTGFTTEMKPSVLQIGMRETLDFPLSGSIEGEAGLQQTWYDYNVGNPSVSYTGPVPGKVPDVFPSHSKNMFLSAFLELHWNIGNLLQGSAGVNGNRYLSKDVKHWNLEPRLMMKVNLPHGSSAAIGYTRVAQFAQQVSSDYIYLPSDAWLPTASIHAPLVSEIYSLEYFHTLPRGFHLKTELWWKNMRNLAEFSPGIPTTATGLPWQNKLTFGKGWAYGADIEFDGSFESLNWNVGYGLMWNWRKFPDINSGKRYPAKFDNRHKIDINIGWKINGKLELTGQWEYLTGGRTTLALYNIATPDMAFPDAPFVNPIDPGGHTNDGIDYYENRNNVRIPAFHRLNLNLSLKGRINNRLSYQWDFGLYNAYCRMNPFAIIKNYVNHDWSHDGSYRKFKTLSLLPCLPSVSYTLNF